MKSISILALLVAAGPVLAQNATQTEVVQTKFEKNSQNCDFTFFSQGDDRLDLRSNSGAGCFDMLSGNDRLSLSETDFSRGVRVFTGPGRDVVLLGRGDDFVTAFDDEDEEYDLRGGDDTLVISGSLASGLSAAGEAPKTIVRPGDGHDKIRFGLPGHDGSIRLRSPNIEVWSPGEGLLDVDAHCGRMFDARLFDMVFAQVSSKKTITANVSGCGLSFEDVAGDIQLEQSGGRLNMSVDNMNEGEGSSGSLVKAKIQDGSTMSATFKTSLRESDFIWEGFGLASINAAFISNEMGGAFTVKSEDSFYGTANLAKGNASMNITAGDTIELLIENALGSNDMSFDLRAPSVTIVWHPNVGDFPAFKTNGDDTLRSVKGRAEKSDNLVLSAVSAIYDRDTFAYNSVLEQMVEGEDGKMIPIQGMADWEHPLEEPVEYEAMSPQDQMSFYYSVLASDPIVSEKSVSVERVTFKIEGLGRKCLDVHMIDTTGKKDTTLLECGGTPFAGDVTAYNKLVLQSEDREMTIDINGSSEFRVDGMIVRN